MDNARVHLGTQALQQESILKRFMKAYGPGIITVLTWLGAGDLIDSSVAGSHFGYDLMWVLILANLVRFAIVNIMARYNLCNTEGITLIERFGRIGKFYPIFFAVAPIVMGHLTNAYMIKGTGEVLYWIFNIGSPLIWSIIVVVASLFIFGKDVYNKLENVMKFLLAIMTLAFVGLAIYTKPDFGGIMKGIFAFSVPSDKGAYDTLLVMLGLVGAVAGSLGNFLYGYFIKDKGWTGPEHKRAQRNDLLFAVCMGAVLVLGVWVVGAQILMPNNIEIKSLSDIAAALEMYLGKTGSIVFYLGAFGALYSSVVGHAVGFPKIAMENINLLIPGRKEKYQKVDEDPLYKKLALATLVLPVIWSLPGLPGFIVLTLFVNALNVVIIPAIAVGLLICSNEKKFLGKYTNNLFENLILVSTTILALYSAFKMFMGFLS